MTQAEILHWIETVLEPWRFEDYCPNNMEVEGDGRKVHSIALAVSLTLEVIEQAVKRGADLILTHHGIFWQGQPFVVTGANRKKLHLLLHSGVATASYHLPLDYHPRLGNNVQLAQKLGLSDIRGAGFQKDYPTLVLGSPAEKDLGSLLQRMETLLGLPPRYANFGKTEIQTLAIATGGAQKSFRQAIANGADGFITGEGSEQNYTEAQEFERHFIAAGHSRSEQFGIQALGQELTQQFGLECFFVETENPF